MLLLLLILFIVIIASSYIAYVEANRDGEYVAGISVTDLSKTEMRSLLQKKVEQWQQEDIVIIAESEYEQHQIPKSMFKFSIKKTVDKLTEKSSRHWKNFFIKPNRIDVPLQVEIDAAERKKLKLPNHIDKEKTLQKAKQIAAQLEAESMELIYKEDPKQNLEKVATVKMEIPAHSTTMMNYVAKQINGVNIYPNQTFSFLEMIHINDTLAQSQNDMDRVATAFYKLLLQTNSEILEHHIPKQPMKNEEIPTTINKQANKDLTFYNPNPFAYVLQSKVKDNVLSIILLGFPTDVTYAYQINDRKILEPKTIHRYSYDVDEGEKKVIQAGKSGISFHVHRVKKQNGAQLQDERIRNYYYPPQHKVIVHALQDLDNEKEEVEWDGEDKIDKETFTLRGEDQEVEDGKTVSKRASDAPQAEGQSAVQLDDENDQNDRNKVFQELEELKKSFSEEDSVAWLDDFIRWLKETDVTKDVRMESNAVQQGKDKGQKQKKAVEQRQKEERQ